MADLVVGVGDMKLSDDPQTVLVTHSLGSCIGLAIYDPLVRVGGLLHYMLPESSLDRAKARENPYMFGDTGIPLLFKGAYDLGARLRVNGDEAATLHLIVPDELADRITADFLGLGDNRPDEEQKQDTIKEALNMIGGYMFSVQDKNASFELGIPEPLAQRELSPEGLSALKGNRVLVDTGTYPMAVAIDIG
ncbi:MAG: chemotaxis protein CheX [Deltaproteobacteria bacterium]|nr:chemotaxis protein CheX [Deltaproteobacteria bacterium]